MRAVFGHTRVADSKGNRPQADFYKTATSSTIDGIRDCLVAHRSAEGYSGVEPAALVDEVGGVIGEDTDVTVNQEDNDEVRSGIAEYCIDVLHEPVVADWPSCGTDI